MSWNSTVRSINSTKKYNKTRKNKLNNKINWFKLSQIGMVLDPKSPTQFIMSFWILTRLILSDSLVQTYSSCIDPNCHPACVTRNIQWKS